MNDAAIEFVDLAPHLRRIDPAYLEPAHAGPAAEVRIHALAWTAADARLYVVVANAFVFWSDNGGRYWHEVPEINRRAGALARFGEQHIDAIVDTPRGTVLLLGRDRHDGPERGVVWRRPAGAGTFTRTVATDPPWGTTKGGNATAGWFGTPPREMVALSVYVSPAHFWFSLDDGVTWRAQDLGDVFAHHVHEVHLHRSATLGRASRLWVTGGDDPSGAGSGVTTFESLDGDGALAGFRYVLRERPGYRLVGLAGDGKHVYVGNESLSGGVLRVQDNAQSIELADFEYALGKARHDYHQFRSLVATADGLLAAATDSYAFVSDTVRADSGGYLYLSNDGGASCRELSLGMKWITGLVYDGCVVLGRGGHEPRVRARPDRAPAHAAAGAQAGAVHRPLVGLLREARGDGQQRLLRDGRLCRPSAAGTRSRRADLPGRHGALRVDFGGRRDLRPGRSGDRSAAVSQLASRPRPVA